LSYAPYLDSWWEQAACQNADPELFFPISGSGSSVLDTARAKAICGGCRIRQQCLDYALDSREVHGVWGGLDYEERSRLVASVPDRPRWRPGRGE
jgi:WhiB family transcriptional regulator, redox-sensing transcriptional regulator